jgi:hypothetical protein
MLKSSKTALAPVSAGHSGNYRTDVEIRGADVEIRGADVEIRGAYVSDRGALLSIHGGLYKSFGKISLQFKKILFNSSIGLINCLSPVSPVKDNRRKNKDFRL